MSGWFSQAGSIFRSRNTVGDRNPALPIVIVFVFPLSEVAEKFCFFEFVQGFSPVSVLYNLV